MDFFSSFFPATAIAVLKDTTGGILHLGFLIIDLWTWPSSHVKRLLYFWMQLNVNIVFFFEYETDQRKET
jgi:hypothetical protein